MSNVKLQNLDRINVNGYTDLFLVSQDQGGGNYISKAIETSRLGLMAPLGINYVATITHDCDSSLFIKCTLTDHVTLAAPINALEGMKIEFWLSSLKTGGGDINLTLGGTILIPTDSGFVSPKVLTNGYSYIVMMKYNGARWMLVSVVGGFELPA